MLYDDTIVAIATPPGEGGIGIVRLSGPQALAILNTLFQPTRAGSWRPYRMRHGHVIAGEQVIDEALAVFMRGPRSFTAEDVVELSCHGGPLVIEQTLQLALAHGARAAEPGEFTMRAFLNGRIDLTQAEATLDVIQARTPTNLRLAQAQLGGWLATELGAVREALLAPLAYVTALIDFPEDEVEPHEVIGPLQSALADLERLIRSADQGMIYRQGARLALVGLPNAGKSSLLNALLRADRAIVTPIPGTTRDTLEETANVHGIPVVLIDTAGITATNDPVERIGVSRSHAALQAADLVLLVLDGAQPFGSAEHDIAELTIAKPRLVVLNKIDLLDSATHAQREAELNAALDQPAIVAISAREGAGLDQLRATIAKHLIGNAQPADGHMLTNPRHREALDRAADHIRDALNGEATGLPPDLLAVDLTAALAAIGEVTGDGVGDDLLAAIFSRFCIGK